MPEHPPDHTPDHPPEHPIDVDRYRQPEHPVETLIYHRWSPRAMSAERLSGAELMRLFEAARWAPSSFNEQPWRFVYAERDGEHWPRFLDLLSEGNRRWAGAAAVLVVVLSRATFERNGKPSRTHSYDTGAAWQNLALQGSRMGLVVHGMAGFDYDKARDLLEVPEEFAVEAMIAVGRPAPVESLPEPLREREAPSGRKPVAELVFPGRFRSPR